MRKSTAVAALLGAAVLALAACGGDDEEPAAETTAAATTAPEEAEFPPVQVELYDSSGPSGMATLADEGGQLTVTIKLSGAPSAEPQPAHIHSGSCATLGDVVYPLNSVVGGISETSVGVTLADLEGTEHAINVHMSEADIGTYVGCGDILFG